MIYLDNSATTFPKPYSVINTVNECMRYYSANPGRSGHKLSMKTAQKVYDCRVAVCKLFNVDNESKVVFTSGCTHSLNIVIKGVLKSGDHCIISSFEHNSVLRPLEKLKQQGITYSVAQVNPYNDDETVENFYKCIRDNTKLIVCTHASNVFGFCLPVERICKLAHKHKIQFCLDAAQTAGLLNIDAKNSKFDFICCPGHKGLYGPMGVGILIINSEVIPDTLIEGGTGSDSLSPNQPEFIPDRFESGTLNIPGICALKSGIEFVQAKGIENINKHEMNLIKQIFNSFSMNKSISIYNDYKMKSVPVLSFVYNGLDSEKTATILSDRFNIATRAGLHCSPLAHKSMGTLNTGTVRISPSIFTTDKDIYYFLKVIKNYNFS